MDDRPGVLIVQIDGLGLDVLVGALRHRVMPFTRRLLRRHGHTLIPTRSGVPSSTPAFQARLFYGAPAALPGFRWYEKASGRIRVMKNYEDICSVLTRMPESAGVMSGGAVYGAFFSGGAERAYFTPGQRDHGYLAGPVGFAGLPRILIHNLRPALRIAGACLFELWLEALDWAAAAWRGRLRRPEGLFPLERVAVNGLLAEIAFLGALGELRRGTPAVFVNMMSFDVMGHHRGPRSLSAMLALRTIDARIRRLWRAAERSGRSYELYVLSDHGQTPTMPFERAAGRSLREAVVEHELAARVAQHGQARGRELVHSVAVLGHLRQLGSLLPGPLSALAGFLARRIERRVPAEDAEDAAVAGDLVVLPTSGLAHVYFRRHPGHPDMDEIERGHPGLAAHLAALPGVRAVVGRHPGGALIVSRDGRMEVGERVTVSGHDPLSGAGPTEAVARDLAGLMAQPESGDLVILAGKLERRRWLRKTPLYASFLDELGGHGGIEPPEQNTFLIAPAARTGLFPAGCGPADIHRGLAEVRGTTSSPPPSCSGTPR
ncbi:MAG TPA: alkaline phosphatase family protein [Planctomycetota bacterium]|nr:alkaline phosphatase family protein [Planctomycetota bacterium]